MNRFNRTETNLRFHGAVVAAIGNANDPLDLDDEFLFSDLVAIEEIKRDILNSLFIMYRPKSKPVPETSQPGDTTPATALIAGISDSDDYVPMSAEEAFKTTDLPNELKETFVTAYNNPNVRYSEQQIKLQLKFEREAKKGAQAALDDALRFNNVIMNSITRDFVGEKYQEAARKTVEQFPQTLQVKPSRETVRTWRRELKASLRHTLAAYVEVHIDNLAARGLPIPSAAERDRMVARATRETLRQTDDLLATLYQAKRVPQGSQYAPKGRRSLDSLLGDGHTSTIGQSLSQRAADNVERQIIKGAIKRGEIGEIVKYKTSGRSSRHSALENREYRHSQGVSFTDSDGLVKTYKGPRDPRMPVKDSSLSKDFIQYRIIGDTSGMWV